MTKSGISQSLFGNTKGHKNRKNKTNFILLKLTAFVRGWHRLKPEYMRDWVRGASFYLWEIAVLRMSYQHARAKIELLIKLCDEDMNVQQSPAVLLLDLPNDLCHPLELLLRARHPQEVYLKKERKKEKRR